MAVRTAETFTTEHYPFFGAAPARAGRVLVSVAGIPHGRYAVQAHHDEDGSGHFRRGLFGLPAEAIRFSRDAPLRLGPSRFGDAALAVTEPVTATRIRLRHVGG